MMVLTASYVHDQLPIVHHIYTLWRFSFIPKYTQSTKKNMSVCIVSAQTGRPITEQLGCGASAAPSGRLISGDGSRPALIIIGRRRWRPLRATAADPTPPTARGPGWPPLDTRRNNARFMEARRGPQLNKTLYIGGGITARARGAGCEAAAARERQSGGGGFGGKRWEISEK